MKMISIKCGQYAYTKDGRVIHIDSVNEEVLKCQGHDISSDDPYEVEISYSDIYGVLKPI